jgi:hypothetical protein
LEDLDKVNIEQLSTLIDKLNLSEHREEIFKTIRPAISISLRQVGQGEIGQSRIGGIPDLPASIPWLKDSINGEYLCFILQINFKDLPTFPETPFPQQGMLYLFANDGENNPEQLIFYNGKEPLQPVTLPQDNLFITDWYEDLVAHCLEFHHILDIPRWATEDYYELCDRLNLDEEKLADLGTSLSQNSIGKLLGHVSGIGHDPRKDAYIVREIDPELLYNYERHGSLDLTQVQNWCNLLELDSDDSVNLMFGDAGYLQVLIQQQKLQQLDFSSVYVNLESS